MWSLLTVAALAAPTSEELLALGHVHCRSGNIVWQQRPGVTGWILQHTGPDPLYSQGGSFTLDRKVTTPATRLEREGAPWQWTEQIRIGGPDLRKIGLTEVDASFRCTDQTDPAS